MSFLLYIILVPLVLCEEDVLSTFDVRQDITDTGCLARSSNSNISYKTFYDTIRHSVNKDYDIVYPQIKVFCYQTYVDSSLLCNGQKLLDYNILLEHCCQNHSKRGYWGQESHCQQCQEGVYAEPPSDQFPKFPLRIHCYHQLKYPQDYFTWCVHILSQKYNISGCMNASGIITQTPAAKVLGLLNLFKIDLLSQSILGELYITKLDPLLDGALVSCSVNKTMAIGFKRLLILHSNSVFYVASQKFPESLVVGQNATAICIFASRRTIRIDFVWLHNGIETHYYSNDSYHETQDRSGYCGPFNALQNYFIVKVSLHIYGINLNDTGQYQCLAKDTGSNVTIAKSPLQHINIIFYEFPSPTIYLFTTRKTVLKCGIKSRYPVSAYWSHNGILLPVMNTTQCNSSDYNIFVTLQTEQLHNGSAMYNLQLHFCYVNMSHEGEYRCGVNGSEISKVIESHLSVIVVSIPTTSTFVLLATGTTSTVHNELVLVLPLVCIGLVLLMGIPLLFLFIRLYYGYKYDTKSELTENNNQTNSAMLKWELPKQSLRYINELGVGHFGQVYKAKIEGLEDDQVVAVKTITGRKGTFELLNELEIMKQIQPHPNICNLRGQCTTSEGPPCIVLEYAVHGSLKQFLLTCRNIVLESGQPLKIISNKEINVTASHDHIEPNIICDHKTSLSMEEGQSRTECIGNSGYLYEKDVYYMADQIIKGLLHLENHKILHRDISARNILISEGFILKVADFGFSRNITEKEYYRKLTNGAIPVKWVAIEALECQVYTYKSDVWSFGVLLWEILSYGETPYKNVDLSCGWEDFLEELKNGLRLSKPDGCSDDLYNVMMHCWETEPQTRPSFSDLHGVFQQFLEQ